MTSHGVLPIFFSSISHIPIQQKRHLEQSCDIIFDLSLQILQLYDKVPWNGLFFLKSKSKFANLRAKKCYFIFISDISSSLCVCVIIYSSGLLILCTELHQRLRKLLQILNDLKDTLMDKWSLHRLTKRRTKKFIIKKL